MANELTIDQKVNGSENIRWDLTDLFNGVDDPKINESLALSGDRAVAFKHKYQNKVKDLSLLDKEFYKFNQQRNFNCKRYTK